MPKVKSHKRKNKQVESYTRRKRKPSKKKIISKKATRLYAVRDGNGQFLGWSSKPQKK